MRQQNFEDSCRHHWEELDRLLKELSKTKFARESHQGSEQLPQLYRQACHDLALAKQRRYTPGLVEYLNQLVMRGHHHLYRRPGRFRYRWVHFLAAGFPQVLRRNKAFVYISLALFLGPALIFGLLCYQNEEMIYSAMAYSEVQSMERMYDPTAKIVGRERESDTDLMMFGFYIKNNIGIGFRTFAGGVFFGLGSIFFLLFNGVVLGGVSGHLTQLGFVSTFYPFVIGHGAFELTAIVFCGAAGLKLGYSLIQPGQYTRMTSLKLASMDAVKIMYGAALFLVIAAFLEAFWSSSSLLPAQVKYGVGALLWLLVIIYCVFAGRGSRHGS